MFNNKEAISILTNTREQRTLIRVGTWNCRGMRDKFEIIEKMIEDLDLDCLFVCETWSCPSVHYPSELIVTISHYMSRVTEIAHWPYGVALFKNRRYSNSDFQIIVEKPGLMLCWKFRGIEFAGIYLPPSLPMEQCIEQLALLPPSFYSQGGSRCMLMGDFNMRVGNITGDRMCNGRMPLFNHVLEMGYHHIWRRGLPATFVLNWRPGYSIPDYIFASKELAPFINNVEVEREIETGNADHRVLWSTITLDNINDEDMVNIRPKIWRWRLGQLKKEEKQLQFLQQVTPKIIQLTELVNNITLLPESKQENQRCIDDCYSRMINIISETADNVLGKSLVNSEHRKVPTASPELEQLRIRSKNLFRQIVGLERQLEDIEIVENRNRLINIREEYKKSLQEEHRMKRHIKKENWRAYVEEIDQRPPHEQLKILRYIKNSRTRTKTPLKGTPGELERARTHFSSLVTRKNWQHNEPPLEITALPMIGPKDSGERLAELIDEFIVGRTVKESSNGKAPGISGVTSELLKACGEKLIPLLTSLFKIYIRTACIPSMWNQAIICPIPKKGDLTKIENYRPISLTEIPRKIFEVTILKTFLNSFIEPLSPAQGGFRTGRSTIDQAACLHEAIQQRNKQLGHYPVVAYMDIKAAYDSVDRTILWSKMRKKGIPDAVVQILEALYDNCTSYVTIQGVKSKKIEHTTGLLQGSVTSPILYCAFLDDIGKQVDDICHFRFGTINGSLFLYADDVAVIADDSQHLKSILEKISEYSIENNFRFAPGKCAITMDPMMERSLALKLYGQDIPLVEDFTYLGIVFDYRGINSKMHLQRLALKGRQAANLLISLGINSRGYLENTKRNIYKAFIRPCLEYGLQLMEPTKRNAKVLETVQNDVLRIILGMPKCANIREMRKFMILPEIEHRQHRLQGQWLRRTERAPINSMIGAIVKYRENRRSNRSKKSIFRRAEKNPLVKMLKRRLEEEEIGETNHRGQQKVWKKVIKKTEFQSIFGEIEESNEDDESQIIHLTMETAKRRLKSWSKAKIPEDHRRLGTRWMLGKAGYGEPQICRRCNLHRVTTKHIELCFGENISQLFLNGEWIQATARTANLINLASSAMLRQITTTRTDYSQTNRPEAPDDWGGI